jgi:hypothetical protein
MALTSDERAEVVQAFVEQAFSRPNRTAHSATDAIRAAVDTMDAALDANVNTLGLAGGSPLITQLALLFPNPFRSASTNGQKAFLFSLILLKRTGIL